MNMEDKYKLFMQAVFNRSYLGLKNQGFKKSTGEFGHCLYRSKVGACAIGQCIPDEKYSQTIENEMGYKVLDRFDDGLLDLLPEGFSIESFSDSLLKTRPDSEDSEFDYVSRFISYLQRAHDMSSPNEYMKMSLQKFARDYNLEIPRG